MAPADHVVTLITRAGCHLCDDAAAVLARLRAELGFGYAELDVDADHDRRNEYSDYNCLVPYREQD